MAELKAKQNANPKKPKVEVLEGADGIKNAYNRTFEAKEIWIQCFTENYKDVVKGDFFTSYFKKFFSSDIKSKELLTTGDGSYINETGSEKNLQLMVDTKDEAIETDFWVYDNKVTFVSFNVERPYALIIEDTDIAKCVRSMYNQAWKDAANSDPRVKQGEKVQTEFSS